ncbi:MAG: hypothetical protein AABW64_04180 [Nanoarchaeota archaeon]
MTALPSINGTKKKGQVSFNESFLVLFIIILLLFLGVYLYYKYSFSRISTLATTVSEEEATVLLASVLQLPELRCTHDLCLNTAHFLPFTNLVQQQSSFYQQLFGYKSIRVEQLYPQPSTKNRCILSLYRQLDYPENCNHWILYERKPSKIKRQSTLSTYTTLFYPESNTYRLGRLSITLYGEKP